MKIIKITSRIMVILLCIFLLILQVRILDTNHLQWWLFAGMLLTASIPWAMIDSIKAIIKGTDKQPKTLSKTEKTAILEQANTKFKQQKYPDNTYQRAIYSTVELLTDYDEKALKLLDTYKTEQWTWSEYLGDLDEEERKTITYFNFMIWILYERGFLGLNDWKFSLNDFIFNSQPTLDYYGIQLVGQDKIATPELILAPEAFQELKKMLPEEFGVGILIDDSDSYLIVIAPQKRLEEAATLLETIQEKLFIVKLGIVEEI